MSNSNHDATKQASDETIRRFLLGSLGASEQPRFEQQFISDSELDARVRLLELDLADEYACGNLTAIDRKLFEQRFLVTADRRRKLLVSNLLRERFAHSVSLARVDAPPLLTRLATFFGLNRPVLRFAFGALILIILFGAVLLIIKEPRLKQRVTTIFRKRPAPHSAPREMNHPPNIPSPEHANTPAPTPIHESAVQSIQTLELFPSAPELGKVPTVFLSNGEKDVLRLQLIVTANEAASYRAEIMTMDGQQAFAADERPGPHVNVDIPMRLLKSGKYHARLRNARDASKTEVASYYFFVR